MDKPADRYDIQTDVLFAPGAHMDIAALAAGIQPWTNRTLSQVNDAVVRLGVLDGDFHWHKHDGDDEFFCTVEGLLLIDLEGRTVELKPGQGLVVPRGVLHRTRAPQRTVILMVENAGIVPTGDA